jgi:signal transduction histidine kinase
VKIGAETVIWGQQIDDLPGALDLLEFHGCEGVEFSQRPDTLGNARELKSMLRDRSLHLLGLAGGTLRERMEFCGDVLRPDYLYVESWDGKESAHAIANGFTLALHPHLYKPIHRIVDAEDILRRHPEVMLLPDTAHLTIAGDAPAQVVAEWIDRITAIHLKDWTPIYGRSSHRYARGFVDLGLGAVNFELLFERLRTLKYDGWLVFEQGLLDAEPEEVVAHAMSWLARRNVVGKRSRPIRLVAKRPLRMQPLPNANTLRNGRLSPGRYSLPKEKEFLETVLQVATGDPRLCHPRLVEAVGKLVDAKLLILCACNPTANALGIEGVYPSTTKLGNHYIDFAKSLSRVAVDRQAVTSFDLTTAHPAAPYGDYEARFGYPELIKRSGLHTMVSIPIVNYRNPHQARFVLNVFPEAETTENDWLELVRLSSLITRAADNVLDERCARVSAVASVRAGECQQSDAFLRELLKLFLESLNCEAASIFLVNDAGNRLEAAMSTSLRWSVPPEDRFYQAGQGQVGSVWQRREAVILLDFIKAGLQQEKSEEGKSMRSRSLVCAPMVDVSGTVIGVVRCRGKKGEVTSNHTFSEDDLAIFDAICQTAVPHLQVLLSKERRAKALRRLTHELVNPLTAIRGAADRMKTELLRRRRASEDYFSQDYIGDIQSWASLMRGLLGNTDLFRTANQTIILAPTRVHLYSDVFMPAANQIQMLLRDRGFDESRIIIPKFDEIPRLWIDKLRLNQVVFNLLSNAIKYAHDEPERFSIRIQAREEENRYAIDFCDDGIGVRSDMSEAIFLEGVRSVGAEQRHVSGDGLGLWVARSLVKAHGGTIAVTKTSDPTTFTIYLPKWLSRQEPK